MHLMDIFTDPSVRFRLIGEDEQTLNYGFRVPLGASQLIIRAGTAWRPSGYDGTLSIDRNSMEIGQFTMETEELPRQTSMCEMSTTNEYQGEKPVGLLLPHVSRSHNIMRDGTESEWVTTFSNCHESTAPSSSHSDAGAVLPGRLRFELALAAPIDARSAAAGDVISA